MSSVYSLPNSRESVKIIKPNKSKIISCQILCVVKIITYSIIELLRVTKRFVITKLVFNFILIYVPINVENNVL